VPQFPHLGAFESIKIHGSGQDVLATTRHDQFWHEDLQMLSDAGILDLRYPVPWHRIEASPGEFDWSWMDGPAALLHELKMRPIFDPLHHVSFPDWLEGGFAHPQFPELYARFVQQIVERYEWVDRYTVFNEPLPTVLLCSHMGIWYPHLRSDADFVQMVMNSGRAICLTSALLRTLKPDVEIIHIDSCEHHRALDEASQPAVDFNNARRFLFHDLILGHIDSQHPLYIYLHQHGAKDGQLQWFADHPAPFDILGLDYYPHSEIDWAWNAAAAAPEIRFPCSHGLGFARVGHDYVARYGCPVMLTETNVGGTVEDRIVWLKIMESQAQILSEACDFRGFCWFPSIDATDWSSLCTTAKADLSPMGVWSLDRERRIRHRTALSDWYVRLTAGSASWRDLPTTALAPPLDRDLAGFLHLLPHD
jgi:beta-glucosidase/6-phospho-beta-glucosidase/beta-galactosidase